MGRLVWHGFGHAGRVVALVDRRDQSWPRRRARTALRDPGHDADRYPRVLPGPDGVRRASAMAGRMRDGSRLLPHRAAASPWLLWRWCASVVAHQHGRSYRSVGCPEALAGLGSDGSGTDRTRPVKVALQAF